MECREVHPLVRDVEEFSQQCYVAADLGHQSLALALPWRHRDGDPLLGLQLDEAKHRRLPGAQVTVRSRTSARRP